MVEVNEFLDYLKDWKTSREIRKHFELSNSGFYHLIKWCKKTNLIENYSSVGVEKGKTNRSHLYKAVNQK